MTDRVNALFAEGHKEIALNLADVPYVNNSGLSAMFAARKIAKKNGAKITFIFATPWWKRILNRRVSMCDSRPLHYNPRHQSA